MSKSYKKFPILKQEKLDKKDWNRKARRKLKINPLEKNILDEDSEFYFRGRQYKKVYPYCKWEYPWTYQEAIDSYKPCKSFPTLESWIDYWKRCCLRK